jgi:diketogulonate reductase-like aldo/keto reductase
LHQQPKLLEFCRSKGIQLQAYAPLGEMRVKDSDGKHILENEILVEIAEKYSASTAQVILRYHYERGIATIPKSKTFSRIEENFQSLNAIKSLDANDWAKLKKLDENKRFFKFGWLAKASPENYPFLDDF